MDQGKRRTAFRSSFEAENIELGNEPPLSVDGENSGFVDRRRVSVQWFAGTILTGLCGAALMGGAVFTVHLTVRPISRRCPNAWRSALRSVVGSIGERRPRRARMIACRRRRANAARAGDTRLHHQRGSGNREIVRVRPFIRVAGNLSLSVSELTAGISAVQSAANDAHRSPGADRQRRGAPGAEPDAEVSFFTRDLARSSRAQRSPP